MISTKRQFSFAAVFLCVCLGIGTQADAHDQIDDANFLLESNELTKEQCPQILTFLKTPETGRQGFEETIIATRAAYWALYMDCQADYPSQPVDVLHAWWSPDFGSGVALLLGSVYEYGIRVDLDLDEARYWYRQAVFMFFDLPEEQQDNLRLKIAGLNPIIKHKTDAEIELAWEAGELKSPVFEEEMAAVRSLMDGPAVEIIAASTHLYRGTNGYPRNKKAAQRILETVSRKGVPEAQYAFAMGMIERRFQTLKMGRSIQWEEAMRYMTRAAGQHYLPAVLKLAKFCENDDSITSAHSAMALYQIAANKGAQGAEASLRQLRSKWAPIQEKWIDEEIQYIEAGITRPCYLYR